jgi:hypothetical protein
MTTPTTLPQQEEHQQLSPPPPNACSKLRGRCLLQSHAPCLTGDQGLSTTAKPLRGDEYTTTTTPISISTVSRATFLEVSSNNNNNILTHEDVRLAFMDHHLDDVPTFVIQLCGNDPSELAHATQILLDYYTTTTTTTTTTTDAMNDYRLIATTKAPIRLACMSIPTKNAIHVSLPFWNWDTV